MEIIHSNKGGAKLCYEGFMYTIQVTRKTKIWWRCVKRSSGQCRGSLTTDLDHKNLQIMQPHNHDADESQIQHAKENLRLKILSTLQFWTKTDYPGINCEENTEYGFIGSPIERKRLFLIDTDPGLDDAQAILMALAVDSINVIALTTVQGNSSSYATCLNALRLLKVADRLDIPVFPGCERPLISPTLNAHSFHGEDGFGEVPDKEAPSMDMAQGEHAVLGLIRLVQENPGEITLVALGPLTNIAMAIRLEPTLGTKLRNCYIMGGNYRGIGNVTRSAEFNFANDPEAAHIVLTELKCPITLITWELCTDMKQPLAFWERLLALPGRKAAFMHNIQSYVRRNREDSDCYIMCDELAMAAAINEATILESHAVYVEVETQGKITKGQLVSDWKNHTGKPANVRIVTKMDMNQVEELLINTYNE